MCKHQNNNCNDNLGICGISPCCLLIAAAIFFSGNRRENNNNCNCKKNSKC